MSMTFTLFCDFAKMPAKLVVHKFERDNYFQSLDINIEDEDTASTKVQFGQWFEGKIKEKKKDSKKCARLVVKIVSGMDNNYFNLDNCAKELNDVENHLMKNSNCLVQSDSTNTGKLNNKLPLYYLNQSKLMTREFPSKRNIHQKNHLETIYSENMCPLEYGLEKVKETNACIMENIQMLNRTLNYTKNREILETVYPKTTRTFPCNTCGKCFVYETGLKRHCAMRHAVMETHPRWQIVWTCIECFQVWPCREVAVKHAIQCSKETNEDYVREIKTSSLLQCEFCEKVFTSIPRLLRHCKMHTAACNYQCNACKLNFSSYKLAEQHWSICPWLRLCYVFSLPKLLLCNACDRKFRTYEQLYNHRYKVGHFIAKSNKASDGKIMGLPVYQCETCGQCFPSTSPLHLHRHQYHSHFDNNNEGNEIIPW